MRKKTIDGLIERQDCSFMFYVIMETEMAESCSLMGNVNVPCSCQL